VAERDAAERSAGLFVDSAARKAVSDGRATTRCTSEGCESRSCPRAPGDLARARDRSVWPLALLVPGATPRRRAAKIQRYACRAGFLAGTYECLAAVREECAAGAARPRRVIPRPRPSGCAVGYGRSRPVAGRGVAGAAAGILRVDSLARDDARHEMERRLACVWRSPGPRRCEPGSSPSSSRPRRVAMRASALARRAPGESLPLSFAQQRLWFSGAA